MFLLCANLFFFQDSERLSPAARLHLFGPNKKASLLTLLGKYCQASSCKGFRLSCQFKPSHKKLFVITSMICIESVSVLAKHIYENKKGLSRVIFVNESYRGTVFILGVIIWQASKQQMMEAWTNLFISLRSINKTHSTF